MYRLKIPTPVSLSDLAADRLREAIVIGHFKPGERLIEAKLSESLGVSRGPLREALRVLATDGLIQIRPNRGAQVVSPSGDELESMVLARAVAEGTCARLLTAQRNADAIEQLTSILAAQKEARKRADHRELIHLHWEFHRTICSSANNQFLLDLWKKVSNVIRIYSTGAIYKTAVENNKVFLDYFRHKPPEASEELLRSQIIAMSYVYLHKPIPTPVRGYVTMFIDDKSIVHDVRRSDDTQIAKLVNSGKSG
jgi:DNA-binding GntR family transcriptional regulator